MKIWLTLGPLRCLCNGARGEDLADGGTAGMSRSVMELAVKIWMTVGPLRCLCNGVRGEDGRLWSSNLLKEA